MCFKNCLLYLQIWATVKLCCFLVSQSVKPLRCGKTIIFTDVPVGFVFCWHRFTLIKAGINKVSEIFGSKFIRNDIRRVRKFTVRNLNTRNFLQVDVLCVSGVKRAMCTENVCDFISQLWCPTTFPESLVFPP